MFRSEDIRKLSDFRQNATAHLALLAESGGIEVLTINGEAKGVVMSPRTFDHLAEQAYQAEITAKIKRGMADIEAGRVQNAHEAMHKLADKHDLKLSK